MSLPRHSAVLCALGLVACLTGHALIGSVPAVGTNQWAAGPALTEARAGATATSLGDGNVLVTGGRGATGPLASVELLTSNGTAVPVAAMSLARAEHTAALVGDTGNVLVAGGTTVVATEEGTTEVVTGSVEVFDSAAAAWYPVGALSHPRAGATAVALPEGRVAIVGGRDASGPVLEIEIYDPAAGAFGPGGAISAPRAGAAVTSTRDGHIVVVGGSVAGVAQATADIIDPVGGTVATVALTSPRTGASATTTVEDQVLIAGGSDGTTPVATTEVLDPVTGNSASGATLSAARADHRAYLLPHNGGVLLVGGSNAGGLVAASELVIPWVNAAQALGPVADARSKTAGAAGPQDGVFVVAGGSNAAGAASASSDYFGFATVKTDKHDYAPGEFVTITGTGWQPGETVNITLHEVGTGAADTPLNAVVEADGTFLNDFWAPNESHLGVRFYLTATGVAARAQTTFTDSAGFQGLDATPTSRTITAGDTTTYTIALDFNGNGTCNATLSPVTGLPAGATGTYDVSSFTSTGEDKSTTLTVTTLASTPATTYTLTVSGTAPSTAGGSGCNGGTHSDTVTLVVTAGNSAPLVAPDNASVAVSEGVTAPNTGTWSDANAANVVTLSASVGTVTKAGTNAAGTWSWSYGTTDGPAQSQTVTITANDGAGGITSTTFALTVNNVPPTATLGNSGPVNEGTAASVSFTAPLDPSTVDTAAGFHYAFACDNGSLAAATYAGSGVIASTSCTFNDNGSFPVKGRIIDKDNGFTEYTTNVIVNNVAPNLTNLQVTPTTLNEGAIATLTGSITDPGTQDTFVVAITWADGSPVQNVPLAAGSTSFSVPHTYVDDNPTGTSSDVHTVSVTVTDDDTGSDTETTTVTVNNVAPTVDAGAGTATVDEGTLFSRGGSFTDPGTGDTWTGSVDYGDGSGVQVLALNPDKTFSLSHTYADNGPFTITVKVNDDDLGQGTDTISVTVNNVAPTVDAGAGTATVNEGAPFSRGGSFTDPGTGDTWTGTVDYDDGSGAQTLVLNADKTFNLSHTYPDNGTFTITIKVKDDDLGEGTDTIIVTVNNVAPTVDAGGNASVNEGSAFAQIGSFTDPGADTWTGTVNYDDGVGIQPLALNSDKTFALHHTYNDNGTFTVTVVVTDDDGGSHTDTVTVTVLNVAPTATLGNNGPVYEGSAVTVSFSGQSDPSSVDTAAGFHYSFSCDNTPGALASTYTTAGTSSSANCTFGDNGSMPVLGRVFDKDNGYTDYTTPVVVNNVAPTRIASTLTFNPYSGLATATFNFSDKGWLDVVSSSFDWAGVVNPGTPASFGPGASPELTGLFSGNHTFGPGCIAGAISVRVNDGDGGILDYELAAPNTLGLYTATFMAPLKDGARNVVKLGNVIPVKLAVSDCGGAPVLNRTLSIWVTAGILDVEDVLDGTELLAATSVSSADTAGIMRVADSHYMYNLATKALKTGLPYTIVIKDGTFVVATAVIEAKK